MRQKQWMASALAFVIICGTAAALAQPRIERPAQGDSVWAGNQQAQLLAQAQKPQQRQPDQRERGIEANEPRARIGEDDPAEEGLTEEEATQRAANQGLIRAQMAIGEPLRSMDGTEIGEIEDLAIDQDRNQVVLGIVSFGGQLGFGDEYVAVPFQAFQPADDGEGLTTSLTKEQLTNAETFDSDNWPDLTSREFVQQTYEQFDQTPYWTEGAEAERDIGETQQLPIDRASRFLGRPVRNVQEDEKLGTLGDMVIDAREGRIVYGVISRGGFFGIGEEHALVPYSELRYNQAEQHYALDMDDAEVEALAFDDDNWPDMTNEQWAANLHQRFGQEPYWQTFGYVAPTGVRTMPGQTPRSHLEEAGVSDERIRELEQQGYPRDEVEQALEEAYREQGLSEEEASRQARDKAQQIEQLGREEGAGAESEADPRQILSEAGLSEEEIDELEADGFDRDEVQRHLEEAYMERGMSPDAARIQARQDAQQIAEPEDGMEDEPEEDGTENEAGEEGR